MMNSSEDRIKRLKKYIETSFKESGKKHLIITGNKKSGKTTILKEILKDEVSYGGIITYAVRDDLQVPKYVILQDINSPDDSGRIAERNEENTALNPLPYTFEKLGTRLLEQYNRSDVELIVIDEIGFLESRITSYQNEMIQSFNHKKMIVTIRKELSSFTELLIKRQDVYFIDIDNIQVD